MKVKELFCRLDGTQVVREAEVPDALFADTKTKVRESTESEVAMPDTAETAQNAG